MRIEEKQCEIFTIYDAPNLDPVTVILQDVGPNNGRIIIECYGRSWSAYWGAMGGNLRDFLKDVSAGYVLNKMCIPSGLLLKRAEAREEAYLLRIIEAVLAAIKGEAK